MKLSILICSLKSREIFYNRLIGILEKQKNNNVEIISSIDNGVKSIGAKRNELLNKASGDYVAFIDDDDTVHNDYIKLILEAIKNNPDCVGIEGIMTTNGRNPEKFIHSLKYDSWFKKNGIYYRNPNHLNPVKREIALSVMFPEINHGEDKDYSERLFEHLKTEEYINIPIYNYLFVTNKNSSANFIKRKSPQEIVEELRAKFKLKNKNTQI